jgi:hypothetical protein
VALETQSSIADLVWRLSIRRDQNSTVAIARNPFNGSSRAGGAGACTAETDHVDLVMTSDLRGSGSIELHDGDVQEAA